MIDRLVKMTVKYRHNVFIRVVYRTLVLLFPLALIGSLARVLTATLVNTDGFLFNLLGLDYWCNPTIVSLIQDCLAAITSVTMGLVGLLACLGAAKYTALHYHRDDQEAGLTGLITMALIAYRFDRSNIIGSFDWRLFGYKFLMINLLVGFLVGQFFRWFSRELNSEAGVDHVIAVRQRSYSAMKPMMISLLFGMVVEILLNIASAYSLFSSVNASLQSQLQGTTGLTMKLCLSLLSTILGWLGLHGFFALNWQNESTQMGANLAYVLSHGSHWHVPYPYLSSALYNVYCRFGGDGIILALVLALLVVDHSRTTRRLAGWSLTPLFFNVDQVAMFGLPIILNPLYLLPMVIMPLINLFLVTLVIYFKLVSPITFPILTGTPGPLMSFMGTGGSIAALICSLALLVIDVVMYLPFVSLAVTVGKRVQQIDRQEG